MLSPSDDSMRIIVNDRLPMRMSAWARRAFVEAGGLMSYGANFPTCIGVPRAYVDTHLEGRTLPICRSSSPPSSNS